MYTHTEREKELVSNKSLFPLWIKLLFLFKVTNLLLFIAVMNIAQLHASQVMKIGSKQIVTVKH